MMDFLYWNWVEEPVTTPASRRSVLVGMSVALFAAACAERRPNATMAQAEPAPDPTFLKLSQSLTGYHDLDPFTAARLSAAFATVVPEVSARFADLARLRETDPTALLKTADTDELKVAALAIVAAWYTGSLGKGSRNATVAYRDALMNRPVADVMLPPTYALGGPGWWMKNPPEIDRNGSFVIAPAPATVGSPEPKL